MPSDPFLGELMIVSFTYAPTGWAMCNGQLLPINQNQALFSLLGTTYGGNGQTTFALPNLQGRVPMHIGNGHVQGESAGEQAHTLSVAELPAHVHQLNASTSAGDVAIPTGAVLAAPLNLSYRAPDALIPMAADTLANTGASSPHQNMAPYLVLNVCIALQGIFPSRN